MEGGVSDLREVISRLCYYRKEQPLLNLRDYASQYRESSFSPVVQLEKCNLFNQSSVWLGKRTSTFLIDCGVFTVQVSNSYYIISV